MPSLSSLNYIFAPVKFIEERDGMQQRLISEKDEHIAELTKPAAKPPYSELALAKLSRLKEQGRRLLEHHISPNQSNPEGRLDVWLQKHRDWRKEALGILNDEDATTFEQPVTVVNNQISGLTAPLNPDHAHARCQLLDETDRIEQILRQDKIKYGE